MVSVCYGNISVNSIFLVWFSNRIMLTPTYMHLAVITIKVVLNSEPICSCILLEDDPGDFHIGLEINLCFLIFLQWLSAAYLIIAFPSEFESIFFIQFFLS